MRTHPSHRLAAVAAAAALAVACAACGSSGTSSAGTGAAGAASTGAASTGAAGSATGQPAGTSGFPATVNAVNGTVHVSSRPAAIVSLSATATEMLYAIGAGGQVKAVDSTSNYPPQAPRTKLSGFAPNVEAIVAAKPDLVVISGNVSGLVKHLAAFSIPVLELPAPTTVAGAYAQFTELGQATGHLLQAQREESSLRAQVAHIVAAEPRHRGLLTYYYELDQTYFSVTSDTFIGKLLSLLGMKSIADAARGAAAAGGYPKLSAEFILKAQPDFVILADTLCCAQTAATVAKRPGWSTLTAVKTGRIVALSDDIASRWGPRIVDLLKRVAAAVAAGSGK